MPIIVILNLVNAEESEIEDIKAYCKRQFSQVKYELGEWDYELVSLIVEHEMVISLVTLGLEGR